MTWPSSVSELEKEVYEAHLQTLEKLPHNKLAVTAADDAKEYLAWEQLCSEIFISGTGDPFPGCVLLTTAKVVCASNNKDKCYRLDYKDVLMHAICKDTEYCPKPCLYLQLEATKLEAQRSSASEQEQTEEHIEEQPEEPLEVRFVPEDSSQLEEFFQAFCNCASLHPDLDDEDYEPSNAVTEEAVLAHLDSVLHVEEAVKEPVAVENQFDDAEDDLEDS